jgi:hypothetical protein
MTLRNDAMARLSDEVMASTAKIQEFEIRQQS